MSRQRNIFQMKTDQNSRKKTMETTIYQRQSSKHWLKGCSKNLGEEEMISVRTSTKTQETKMETGNKKEPVGNEYSS